MQALHKGHGLVELMTVLSISLIMMAMTMPLWRKARAERVFAAFTMTLAGDLARARLRAQVTEAGVYFTLEQEAGQHYAYFAVGEDGDELLGRYGAEPGSEIRLALPGPLTHPTTGQPLVRPLSSTHAPRIVFGPHGSSSATLVFSDADGRTLCAVLSASSGRFRIYLRSPDRPGWQLYH